MVDRPVEMDQAVREAIQSSATAFEVLVRREVASASPGSPSDEMIRSFVERVERTKEFTSIVDAVSGALQSPGQKGPRDPWEQYHFSVFLKLSNFYIKSLSGHPVSLTEAVLLYVQEKTREQVGITYLAPLEFVKFSSTEPIPFGRFTICRFKKDELDELLKTDPLRIFHKHTPNTWLLSQYWFLVAKETAPPGSISTWSLVFDSRVPMSYSDHPSIVEAGLRQLSLYAWDSNLEANSPLSGPTKRPKDDSVILPHVPFVLRVSDSLIEFPSVPIDLASLALEPYFDADGNESEEQHPVTAIDLDTERTVHFSLFLQDISSCITSIQQHAKEWMFINVALGFLLKADYAKGLEQLLWYIAAIEATLGRKQDSGLTEALARRIGIIFGGTENDKTDRRKRFKNLYSFRSDLVHGNASLESSEIMEGHLVEARDFARGTIAWFIKFLAYISQYYPPDTNRIPKRNELLQLIDLDADSRRNIFNTISVLPNGFPSVPDWFR